MLEPSQTYVLGMFNTGPNAVCVQQARVNAIPEGERWTHCAALLWCDVLKNWTVIESRWPQGCQELGFVFWQEQNRERVRVEAFPCPELNVTRLRAYLALPFPTRYALAKLECPDVKREKTEAGVYCSELLALCGVDLGREPGDTAPTDLQVWAQERGREMIVLKERPIPTTDDIVQELLAGGIPMDKIRMPGQGKDVIAYISEDFDAPLDDFGGGNDEPG